MKLYDGLSAHTVVPRLFAAERKGLTFTVVVVDMPLLDHRRPAFLREVNSRGEMPALELDDGSILTEVTAICEYFDEISTSSTPSLFGADAAQRAHTRMWLRRADLEIVQPLIQWYRDDPTTIDYYRGNRVPNPNPEGRHIQKVRVSQALNRFDDELAEKMWLCGDRFSAADVHFYALMKPMCMVVDWANMPARPYLAAWYKRMDEREAVKRAMMPFDEGTVSF